MPLTKPVRVALKSWRSVFGDNTWVESWVKNRYLSSIHNELSRERGEGWVQYSGRSFVLISESDDFPEPRRGVVLKGGCDMPSVYTAAPMIRGEIEGTIAIARHFGGTGGNRSDQILQTLDDLPDEAIAETQEMLDLGPNYFNPTFFEQTFTLPKMPQAGSFSKDVVILSIASDLTRQMYRHREHGFLADPGGWWLNQDLGKVLDDLTAVEWFRKTFRRVGRMSVDEFRDANARLVGEIRSRLGAQVFYYNQLVVDPSNPAHNYQLVNTAHSIRRRQFAIALSELSQDHDFPIVDIDRLLKTAGVDAQVDFAHFPVDRMVPIGAEVHRIMKAVGFV
jgi:hypothetical protein